MPPLTGAGPGGECRLLFEGQRTCGTRRVRPAGPPSYLVQRARLRRPPHAGLRLPRPGRAERRDPGAVARPHRRIRRSRLSSPTAGPHPHRVIPGSVPPGTSSPPAAVSPWKSTSIARAQALPPASARTSRRSASPPPTTAHFTPTSEAPAPGWPRESSNSRTPRGTRSSCWAPARCSSNTTTSDAPLPPPGDSPALPAQPPP